MKSYRRPFLSGIPFGRAIQAGKTGVALPHLVPKRGDVPLGGWLW
jgi:hypothetical protein